MTRIKRLSSQFVMLHTPQDKETIRESILTHLNYFSSIGLHHVIAPNNPPELAVTLNQPAQHDTVPSPAQEPACLQKPDLATIDSLVELHRILTNCQLCKLSKERTHVVFGVGNPNADLMFVGEGPGADEDAQGEPFVGKAGQLLTKIINSMGFERQDVYIANVVKCRPPNNRNPELDEIEACMPFLKKQIELVQPKIIMCLGKFAAQTVLNTQIQITKLRGQFQNLNGILVMPAFHPAYLLRNPGMKRIMWEDCKVVMSKLEELGIKPMIS